MSGAETLVLPAVHMHNHAYMRLAHVQVSVVVVIRSSLDVAGGVTNRTPYTGGKK